MKKELSVVRLVFKRCSSMFSWGGGANTQLRVHPTSGIQACSDQKRIAVYLVDLRLGLFVWLVYLICFWLRNHLSLWIFFPMTMIQNSALTLLWLLALSVLLGSFHTPQISLSDGEEVLQGSKIPLEFSSPSRRCQCAAISCTSSPYPPSGLGIQEVNATCMVQPSLKWWGAEAPS